MTITQYVGKDEETIGVKGILQIDGRGLKSP
jgi:hypothetical protein